MIEITREKLFKQISERPMIKVAAEYGISDAALKKICVKHRIPAPARGYWAKKAAGKKVQRAYFRRISDPAKERILIYGSPTKNLPEEVKQAQASAREREQKSENKIVVPELPKTLHPLVERTAQKLERGKLRLSLRRFRRR